MTAAEYAAILDPERKVEGWWRFSIYRSQPGGGFKYRTETTRPNLPNDGTYKIYDDGYHGPPDLHTARSEAWRGEDYLHARGYTVMRDKDFTRVFTNGYQFFLAPFHVWDTDHAAAIAEAVRRVNDGISN